MVHESGLMWEELIQISMRRVRNLPQMCEYAYCGRCNCLLAFTKVSSHQRNLSVLGVGANQSLRQ